ncbi:Uncharacterized conserved protein [Burkholderia sp. D7]|nr:Uncharacterized conserved protein [Burkholderia sp. D7]
MSVKKISACVLFALAAFSDGAYAYEPGYPGWSIPSGAVLTMSAASPPPGFYSFNEIYTAQGHRYGPGDPSGSTPLHVATAVTGILWSPGWTFLGGRYEALIVQPFMMADAGAPLNQQSSGIHNTLIAPAQISWKLGDTGFHVKAGFAVTVPDGTITGTNGLAGPGAPWWIFQPLLSVSCIKHGWNVTGNFSIEVNTPNTETHYRTGDILHADFAATKTLGNWSIGPVASYVGQVSNDTSSAFYHNAINVDRYNVFSVGALVGYKFGPASVNLWAMKDISASASGGPTGPDKATIPKGYKIFANLTFRF